MIPQASLSGRRLRKGNCGVFMPGVRPWTGHYFIELVIAWLLQWPLSVAGNHHFLR